MGIYPASQGRAYVLPDGNGSFDIANMLPEEWSQQIVVAVYK